MKQTKKCTKCKKVKSTKEFARTRRTPDGIQYWCRKCFADYQTEWRRRKSSQLICARSQNRWRMTAIGRANNLLNNAKHVAKVRNLELDLTRQWVVERILNGKCEVTGIDFQFNAPCPGHRTNSFAPSIDRINQTGGYTQQNCRVVVWIYNRARGAFPDADFNLMIQALSASVSHRKRPQQGRARKRIKEQVT